MQFSIPPSHPCLSGHFPGRPVVPGVVVLDRVLAAVAAQCGEVPAALRLPQVKFLLPLLPGELARIELQDVAAADARRWRFRVLRGDQAIVTGEVAWGAGA